MALNLKVKLPDAVPVQAVAVPVTPALPPAVAAAIDKAKAEGIDPYLAGITAKSVAQALGASQLIQPTLPPIPSVLMQPAASSEVGEASTILDHLRIWRLERSEETLMLVNKKTDEAYTVLGYSIDEQQVTLRTPLGGTIKPRIGMREVPQYTAIWR